MPTLASKPKVQPQQVAKAPDTAEDDVDVLDDPLEVAPPEPIDDGFGTPPWKEASVSFRQVLASVSGGDKARMSAVVAYVKTTQKVGSSREMNARDLKAWCQRLEFMSRSGDLEEFIEEHWPEGVERASA